MTKTFILTGLALAGVALPMQAHADLYTFDFTGTGVSGRLAITYEANPNTGPLPLTVPNPVDPVGSYVITGVTGTVSNANLGLTNVKVGAVLPLNRVSPEAGNTYAPNSFSLLPIASGVPVPGGGTSPGFHYDNLFYPGGSPRAAFDYPFGGGVFDIYGVAFTLETGDLVNFWSNGNVPPNGLNYGIAFTDGIEVLDYADGLSIAPVPEPATWAMTIVGFGLVGGTMRRRYRLRLSHA